MTSRGRGRGRNSPNKQSPENRCPAPGLNGAPPGLTSPRGVLFQEEKMERNTQQQSLLRDMRNLDLEKTKTVGLKGFLSESKDPILDDEDDNLGKPIIASKPDKKGDQAVKTVPLVTNVWVFNLPTDMVLYRYNVTITKRDGRYTKELTKGASNDHRREEKRKECYEIFREVIGSNRDVFQKPFAALYDRRKMYYSRFQLPFTGKQTFQVGESTTMVFEYAGPLTLGSFEADVSQNLDLRTRDQQQVLEVLTSQVIFFNQKNDFVQLGRNVLDMSYDPQTDGRDKSLGGGKYLASGHNKGVRLIEGENGEPTAALQQDQKKSAVYIPQNVIWTVCEILTETMRPRRYSPQDIRELNKEEIRQVEWQLKDISVKLIDHFTGRRGQRTFEIAGITQLSAIKQEFDFKDEKKGLKRILSVAMYFKDIKKYPLKYPGMPCLVEKKQNGRTNFYPMEICIVGENQRVPIHKQTPDQMQIQIKKSALKPSDKIAELEKQNELSRVRANEFLEAFDIQITQKPLVVMGRVLKQPAIQYEPGKGPKYYKVNPDGSWDMKGNEKWYSAGKCGNWAIVCLDPNAPPKALYGFADKYTKLAKTTGIQFTGEPALRNCAVNALEAFFKEMGRMEMDFLLFIMNNRKDNNLKDQIKNFELKYEIITQCVRVQTVADIGDPKPDPRSGMVNRNGGNQKLMNILAKTNMKLGGLNFQIVVGNDDKLLKRWFSGGVLYLGVDVNHPPPRSAEERRLGIPPKEPSVIGMVGSSPEPNSLFRFTGEHWFQDPTVEKITAMKELTLEFLRRYANGAKTVPKLPNSVILFRDGVSEGQYKMLLDYEIPAMRKAFEEFSHGWSPKLTVVVVLKRHTLRLMNTRLNPNDRASAQDIPVGTVVDHTVVHPTNWEFYLQSHRAIQGTAKCPKYCVIVDDNGFSQNEMEGVSFVLAHSHQIVSKSVSLPAPVYGADEMAERGKRLFRAENGGSDASSSGYSANDLPDWDEFSRKHKIGGSKMEDRKHWA